MAAVLGWAVVGLLQAASGDARNVVVIPFAAPPARVADAERAEGLFRDAAEKLPELRVATRAQTVTMLEQAGEGGFKCQGGPTCYASLAHLLDADILVVGEVAEAAGELTVSLSRIGGASRQEENRVREALVADPLVLSEGMRRAAVQLLAPTLYVGGLEVHCGVEGASVWVGSSSVAQCPRTLTVPDLLPGSHAVAVKRAGMTDVTRRVDVRFERVTVVYVEPDAAGARIRADVETKAMAPSRASAAAAAPAVSASRGGPLGPLAGVGAGVAALGGVGALLGVAGALGSGVLTLAWPRTEPLGSVKRFSGESVALAQARLLGVAGLVPAGLLLAGLGLGVVTAGVVLVVVDLVR